MRTSNTCKDNKNIITVVIAIRMMMIILTIIINNNNNNNFKKIKGEDLKPKPKNKYIYI